MRHAFTIGIKNDGSAELLQDSRMSLRDQRAALKTVVDEYKEIFILTSTRAQMKRRISTGGNVNPEAALPVVAQRDKKLRDQFPSLEQKKGNPEGKVNPEAAKPVSETQPARRKPASKKRRA